MGDKGFLENAVYDPNRLLDALIERLHLKNDAALARVFAVDPPIVSKIRHRALPISASMLIRMSEITDLSIRGLQAIMGDRRRKFRISTTHFKPKRIG